MRYQGWNKEKLKMQLDELTKANPTYEEREDYETINSILNPALEHIEDDIPFRQAFKIELQMLGLYQEFLKDIVKFSKNTKYFPKRPFIMKEKLFSYDEIFEFLYKFYTKIDKDISKIFKNVYKEKNYNFKFNNVGENVTYDLQTLKYAYISSSIDADYSTLLNIIHEYAHAISFRMTNINRSDYYPYVELMPMFMEAIATDKIADSIEDDSNKKEVFKALGSEYQYMLKSAEDLSYLIKYYNYVDEINFKKYVVDDLVDLTDISKTKANDILSDDNNLKLMYVPTYLVVIELYYLYKKDPEKAIYLLKNIISTEKKKNYTPYLERNKIYLNEHSREFTKTLAKKIKGSN